MDRTFLIQRLKKPFDAKPKGALALLGDNPFAFGGGLRNGGLSSEAVSLLRDIWRFDYMGSAEFEFGAVPEGMEKIARAADAGDLDAWSFTIPLTKVEPSWEKEAKAEKVSGEGTIYVLAPREWAPEVEARITALAKKRYNGDLKETTGLAGALRPFKEWETETCGWLELNNGFLFFTDREMWEKTCTLFDVDERDKVDAE